MVDTSCSTVAVYELTATEREELERLYRNVTASPYAEFDAFLGSVRKVGSIDRFIDGIRTPLGQLRKREGPGALLIRGMSVPADLRPTPSTSFSQLDVHAIGTEKYLASAICGLGEPFSYAEWDKGYLVHNKYPLRAHREIQFGSNAVEFRMHTETPFRDVSPDYLALFCIRTDPTGAAKTRVAHISAVIDGLDSRITRLLAEPRYAFETDNPVVTVGGVGLTAPQPIVTRRNGHRMIEYVGDLVATDAAAQDALDQLHAAVDEAMVPLPLSAGDLLILDNSRVVHGRTAFEPRYDGTDRWLQRMLVTCHMFDDGIPPGRMVSDRRFAHYPTDYQQVLQSPV